MLQDNELGMSSDARSDASDTADADAELEPSADSDPTALEVAHGANAAGAADTAGGAAVAQPEPCSLLRACHAQGQKKTVFNGPGACVYDDVETVCKSGQYSCVNAAWTARSTVM
jgi:hypothetical protein